jgi:hypothetical protein
LALFIENDSPELMTKHEVAFATATKANGGCVKSETIGLRTQETLPQTT